MNKCLTLYLCLLSHVFFLTACDKEIIDFNVVDNTGVNTFSVNLYASNLFPHQSAAVYGDYCIIITNKRSSFTLYNLAKKQILYKLNMKPEGWIDMMGNDLFHCNQASFGVEFYNQQDVFPLLYVSQRARNDLRCFVEVYRIEPIKSEGEEDYSSMNATLVQTIYFPVMNEGNCLGNVNCVIDRDRKKMYTYSRNNEKSDFNYGRCKISCFDIPNANKGSVVLEDKDIKDSFMLNCSAINMQGGCIVDDMLYIGQGYEQVGYIYLNVINLKNKCLDCKIDLLAKGIRWEPEGCFYYNEKIMVSTESSIWEFIL